MNRPTHIKAHYELRRQVIFSPPDEGAQLIADSEARAVATLTADRDQLRSEVEELKAAGGPPFIRSKAIQNLREEVARLNNLLLQADELNEGALFKISETIARAYRAEAALAAERERVRVLRSALETLCDEQHGAPHCTREEQWTQAMDRADAALAATEGAK
jgi:hypothetical protein